ncbi:MAG: acyl carrier protein [Opitutae bacterium]|nr:acyl carrier protein [Opitutae bacterium]
MQSQILEALINEVRSNKRQPPITNLTAMLRLREDLDFASLDLAELTVRIEEKFGVDVFADGLVHTVGEIAAKLEKAAKQTTDGG